MAKLKNRTGVSLKGVNKTVTTFEQHVDGDWNVPGNKKLSESNSLRAEMEYIRTYKKQLIERGCEVQLIRNIYPMGYGYEVTEPPKQGELNVKWNLLAVVRIVEKTTLIPPRVQDILTPIL